MSQGEQLFFVREYSSAPGRVTLMTNYNLFLKRLDCLIQNCRVLILIWTGELVLVLNEMNITMVRQFHEKRTVIDDKLVPAFIEVSDKAPVDLSWNRLCL